MHFSNAGLLALWLILYTQGHEDFLFIALALYMCAWVRLCVCEYASVCTVFVCMHLFVCFLLFFHFTFTKSPILMSCHWQLLPTLALTLQDGGVRVCYFVPLCASKW